MPHVARLALIERAEINTPKSSAGTLSTPTGTAPLATSGGCAILRPHPGALVRRSPFLTAFFLCSLISPPALAGGSLKDIIGKDRVQVVDGKMQIVEYDLCKNTVPGAAKSSIQIKSYAEAPVSAGISRDFLVSFESGMQTLVILIMGTAAAKGSAIEPLNAFDCDPISAPIGKVDFELNLYLAADGYQMAIVDGSSGNTSQESKSWDDDSK